MSEMEHLDDFSQNPLGEGFLSDKIFSEKNTGLAQSYCSLFPVAREYLLSKKIGSRALESLHRYNRFLAWISYKYGKIECNSQEEADTFVKSKLYELMTCTGDWLSFWKWMREITLSDAQRV